MRARFSRPSVGPPAQTLLFTEPQYICIFLGIVEIVSAGGECGPGLHLDAVTALLAGVAMPRAVLWREAPLRLRWMNGSGRRRSNHKSSGEVVRSTVHSILFCSFPPGALGEITILGRNSPSAHALQGQAGRRAAAPAPIPWEKSAHDCGSERQHVASGGVEGSGPLQVCWCFVSDR